MCSIGEDDFGDEGGVHAMVPNTQEVEETLALGRAVCNKCKNPGAVYKLPFREAECKECFLLYACHKFRAALGSSKILPREAYVLLVFDGSAQSLVLLDMLHHAQNQNAFKRLHCHATVIYIDDMQLMQDQGLAHEDDNRRFLENLKVVLSKYDSFRCFVIPFVHKTDAENSVFALDSLDEDYFSQQLEMKKQEFLRHVMSIKSSTSRQDFIKHHRSKLIAVAAKQLKCKFAFISDISSDLATELLCAVALGRGDSAAQDVALVDNRLGDGVLLCRPLKDLSVIEVELYLKAQQLQVPACKRLNDGHSSSPSLQNLTKAFVSNLQENFSSTVSTVYRTGSKIAANQEISSHLKDLKLSDGGEEISKCSFCNSHLDYRDSTTLLAIEFSRVVSESGNTSYHCDDLSAKAEKNLHEPSGKQYFPNLCHGCRNIYSDCSTQLWQE